MVDSPDTWDNPNLSWDSGLQWDINLYPSYGDVTPYLDKVTSEHRDKPNFIATLTTFLQSVADLLVTLQGLLEDFDLDQAIGAQLDIIGQWVGVSRELTVPLTGVYFTLDTGPGLDRGALIGPFDPITGLVSLPDYNYRLLLYAKIAANQWDGTLPGAQEAYDLLFSNFGFVVFVYDNQNMTMSLALVGGVPDAITLALFTGGYLDLKPAAVRVDYYAYPVTDGPVFALDLPATDKTAGLDNGHFAEVVFPT